MTNIRYRFVHVNMSRFVEPMAQFIRMNACCVSPTGKLNLLFYIFLTCEFGVFRVNMYTFFFSHTVKDQRRTF